jgi:hypothetical protein
MPIIRVNQDIPRLEIPFYRGDTSVFRVLLASDVGTLTATSGSASLTITDTDVLLAGMNLYTADSDARFIGTIDSVGSGTATLVNNATFSYSGAYKVGIGWETAIDNATCDITRFGSNQPVISLELGDGITLDGDWVTLDFTATDTLVRADKYQGDFRVLLADGQTVQTLFQIVNAPFTQNRSQQP